MFVEILAILFVLIFLYVYKDRRFKYYLQNYKGPRMLPAVGNLLAVGNDPSEFLHYLRKYQKEYGSIYKLNFGVFNYGLVVTDADFLEFVLSSYSKCLLNKSFGYKFTKSWLGTGLTTASPEKWKRNRKIINPAFSFKILENFVPTYDKTCKIMIENILKRNDLNCIDVYSIIALCSLDIICETAMGATLNAQQNADSEYVESVKGICEIVVGRALSPIKLIDATYRLTQDYQKERKYLKVLHEYTNRMIKKRRDIRAERKTNNEDTPSDEGIRSKVALMDLLLTAKVDGNPLSESEIADEINTFLFAGHDTTTSAASFAIYLLSNHPEVQQQAFEEQKNIFRDDIYRPVTSRDLQEMKYLDLIIKETLRLYPSVPLIARQLSEDVDYKGQLLLKGLILLIFPYGLHRNEEYFPEPEVFDPNRFIDMSGKHPFSYLPFSAGPRNCIGQKFAGMEIKTMLSHLIRNFKITPVNPKIEIKLSIEVVLVSKTGINVKLQKR